MIPIVAIQETKAKKATVFFVSYLWVVARQMIEAKISAKAVEVDIKNKLPGIVSK